MARAAKIISNRKGQALLESIAVLCLAGPLLLIMLQSFLRIIFIIAVESMAEDYFMCELAKEQFCIQKLEARLHDNKVQNVRVEIHKKNAVAKLTIYGTHVADFTITREFDYGKFNQKI